MSPAPSTTVGTPTSPWAVVITEWALDSYLEFKHAHVFTDAEYWTVLRPDVELLRTGIPSPEPKFASPTFWGPAKQGSRVLLGVYKMKWRKIGPGQVQLGCT
jgi:hypothetical protein